MPPPALRTLLADLIDYAGLFPPAGLGMERAVREYAAYKDGEHAWMLGRFVVPIERLGEFEAAAIVLPQVDEVEVWKLSVLSSPGEGKEAYGTLARDLREVAAFNARHAVFEIDAVEVRVDHLPKMYASLEALRDARSEGLGLIAFYEVPLGDDTPQFIEELKSWGAFAKVRTGGLTAEAFPTPVELERFIRLCHLAGLPFKATAGLHHALRGLHPYTYEPGGESGAMHGFLNVFLAAGFIGSGMSEADAVGLLEEASPDAFAFVDDGVTWNGHRLSTDRLRRARMLARSFGSCSITEPVEDLRTLGLL